MSHKRRPFRYRTSRLMLYIWLALGCGCLVSAAEQPKKRLLRIAVVPVKPTVENLAAAAMVQTEVETHSECEAIEREQIAAVLREKEVQSAGGNPFPGGLGQTLQADGFLFVEVLLIGEQKRLRLTAVEARSGALVMARSLATNLDAGSDQAMKEAVADGLHRVGAAPEEACYVAWLGISPDTTGAKWLEASRALTALVEMHLSSLPRVALLDRSRLQHVGEEAFISGLDQNLRSAVILLDGRLRPADVTGHVDLQLRARWPSSGRVTNLQVRAHLQTLERGAQDLTAAAAALLALPRPPSDLHERQEDEIALLAHRTSELLRVGAWSEALEAAETLYTFAPTQQLYRAMLFGALDAVAANMKDRLGRTNDVDEGRMLDLILRSVDVRTRYVEDLDAVPTSGYILVPFETGYRCRPVQTSDSQDIRNKLQALAESEDQMFRAQLATGERYCQVHGYPFLLIRAARTRMDQLATWHADDPVAQVAFLRQAAAAFKRTLILDIRPSQVAVKLLLGTVSPEMCKLFGDSQRGSAAFQGYLTELSTDSNAWYRLAAGRGVCTARHEGLPLLVPVGMPDDPELARQAARIMRYEILPNLLSEKIPRLAYKPEIHTRFTDLLDRCLLLDAGDSLRNRFRQFTNTLTSDPVRLAELAAILEETDSLPWLRYPLLFSDNTKRAILNALVKSGQEPLAQRIQGISPTTEKPKQPTAPSPAQAPTVGVKGPIWDDYRVMRAGPGYPRQRGQLQRTIHGVPFARDQEWVFLQPDGDSLYVADVQAWKNRKETLMVRLLRLQLPTCQVMEDRLLSMDCPVPDNLSQEVNSFAYGNGMYFLATRNGLLIIDEKTFVSKRLTAADGLPCNQVTAVAWFDQALFLATLSDAEGSAASLLRLDIATGAFEELAAQRTLSRRTPLDGTLFEVTDMFPDPAHGRLLLRIRLNNSSRMEIWEWRPATKSLACIQANPTLMNVYWLPSSRNDAHVGGNVKAFLPASDNILTLPECVEDRRIACEGETIFATESWGRKEDPCAVQIVNQQGASVRRAHTDEGFPMTHLVALAATDAGIVLVNIFGETFLIRRLDRIDAYTVWDLQPIQGGPAESALLRAAYSGHAGDIRQALSQGANVQVRCRACETPLTLAIVRQAMDSVQVLMAAGADCEYASLQGNTPLMTAALSGHNEILALLLKANANPNVPRPYDGATPLHAAAMQNNVGAAKMLLAAGAACDARIGTDGLRVTPLMFAVKTNDTTLAKLLIAHGANVSADNGQGANVLQYAIDADNAVAIKLLRNSGSH